MAYSSKFPSTSPPGEVLYTPQEVARKARISVKTVRRLIACGELKIHRIGAQIRVSESDWQTFLALSRQS